MSVFQVYTNEVPNGSFELNVQSKVIEHEIKPEQSKKISLEYKNMLPNFLHKNNLDKKCSRKDIYEFFP